MTRSIGSHIRESRNIDLLTDFTPGEDWKLSLRVGYTDAEGNTDSQPFVEFGAPAVFDYDLRGRAPSVTYVANGNGVAVDPTNPDSRCSLSSARFTRS